LAKKRRTTNVFNNLERPATFRGGGNGSSISAITKATSIKPGLCGVGWEHWRAQRTTHPVTVLVITDITAANPRGRKLVIGMCNECYERNQGALLSGDGPAKYKVEFVSPTDQLVKERTVIIYNA